MRSISHMLICLYVCLVLFCTTAHTCLYCVFTCSASVQCLTRMLVKRRTKNDKDKCPRCCQQAMYCAVHRVMWVRMHRTACSSDPSCLFLSHIVVASSPVQQFRQRVVCKTCVLVRIRSTMKPNIYDFDFVRGISGRSLEAWISISLTTTMYGKHTSEHPGGIPEYSLYWRSGLIRYDSNSLPTRWVWMVMVSKLYRNNWSSWVWCQYSIPKYPGSDYHVDMIPAVYPRIG